MASVLALGAGAPAAQAALQGATYRFGVPVAGDINNPLPGTYTDPANPSVCVNRSAGCPAFGLSVGFSFTDLTATTARITFAVAGGANASGPFQITLGNFVTVDGATVTDIVSGSGQSFDGSFGLQNWDGTTATFIATPVTSPFSPLVFAAPGRTIFISFDVTLQPAAPVPAPPALPLLGAGLLGLLALVRRPA
ncbi:hypothetical protein E2C05_26405 [Paracraurococcus ruber]|uniref:PEP-CTERM protein-sorting domain-containing protein n=2 Tax=Paracraurococcus ruber TaxID=77675 RepID=A0ABS1D4A2_9PROT|nr:hypothetical protein [Paracraurococcus ruber]TDG23501.1 hypothetical protein E2C05_26405 [Paracraurococcus ruber]